MNLLRFICPSSCGRTLTPRKGKTQWQVTTTQASSPNASDFFRRAVNWSAEIREGLGTAGSSLNDAFEAEAAVELITEAVARRWKEVHTGGTDAEPKFRPIDLRFEEFVRKICQSARNVDPQSASNIDPLMRADGQRWRAKLIGVAEPWRARVVLDDAL